MSKQIGQQHIDTNLKTQSSQSKQYKIEQGQSIRTCEVGSPKAVESIEQKHKLKQQAKQLLLKQCYKISMNKYLRLISMGASGFTQRQWSIIHVNTAISMQYQDKLSEALQKLNQAIKIDPLYEKAYFRRLQVLDEMGQFEVIMDDNVIPIFIKNQQIEKLRKQLWQKYRESFGFDSLFKKVQKIDQIMDQIRVDSPSEEQSVLSNSQILKNNKFVREMQENILKRIIDEVQRNLTTLKNKSDEQANNVYINLIKNGKTIAQYYECVEKSVRVNMKYQVQTKEQKLDKGSKRRIKYKIYKQYLQEFYQGIYKLCIKYLMPQLGKDAIKDYSQNKHIHIVVFVLLQRFWQSFIELFLQQILHQRQAVGNFISVIGQEGKEKHTGNKYGHLLVQYCPLAVISTVDLDKFLQIMLFAQNSQAEQHKARNTGRLNVNANYLIKFIHINCSLIQALRELMVDLGDPFTHEYHRTANNQSVLYEQILMPMAARSLGQQDQTPINIKQQKCIGQRVDQFINKHVVGSLAAPMKSSAINMNISEYRKCYRVANSLLSLQEKWESYRKSISKHKRNQMENKPIRSSKLTDIAFIRLFRSQHQIQWRGISNDKTNHHIPEIVAAISQLNIIITQETKPHQSNNSNNKLPGINIELLYIIYEIIQSLQPFIYEQIHKANQKVDASLQHEIASIQQAIKQVVTDPRLIQQTITILQRQYAMGKVRQQDTTGRQENNKEVVIKYLLNINILAYLSPTFYTKILQTSKTKQPNDTSSHNSVAHQQFSRVLVQVCNISNMFQIISNCFNHMHLDAQPNSLLVTVENIKQLAILYMQTITILAVSHPLFLTHILKYPHPISCIYSLIFNSKTSSKSWGHIKNIQYLMNPIKLLYAVVVDLGEQQQQEYSERMGVGVEQIRKAKQLQGETIEIESKQLIQKQRDIFISHMLETHRKQKEQKQNGELGIRNKHISKYVKQKIRGNENNWSQIINQIVNMVNESNSRQSHKQKTNTEMYKDRQQESENSMLISIILKLASKDYTKFYTNPIITFMIHSFHTIKQRYHEISKSEKHSQKAKLDQKQLYRISVFFTKICKKCNANMFPYPQLQPITNCLTFLLLNQSAKHQLQIFQCFLSLVNLSAKNVNIPIDVVYIGLIQQNQYIVHGALELLNNILVNGVYNGNQSKQTQNKFWSMYAKIQELVHKYYRYYKGIVQKQIREGSQATNTHDYSHPFKIYCTLFAVLMIIQSMTQLKQQYSTPEKKAKTAVLRVVEFQDWTSAAKILRDLYKNHADIAMTLFKLVLHHADNKTLPNGWSKGLEAAIQNLKLIDIEKWGKLQKFIK